MDDLDILAAATKNTPVGPYWDVIEAPAFNHYSSPPIQLGVRNESFQIAARTGTAIAQYVLMVRFGLANAGLLFRGLQRDMKVGNDMHADKKVVAYVWRPETDFEWVGGRQSRAFPVKHVPPPGRVFVVLVRQYDEPDTDGISGAVLKWNWVHGDLVNGPINDGDGPRYLTQLWNRNLQ